MKKILVHNFTRIGDLLQSTPLLIGLKDREPHCEIVLAIHKRFQEVCEGFPFVDTVISFDSDGLKETILQGGDGLLKSYRYVKSFTDLLKEQHFDLVINLSHSRSSCILLSMLDSQKVIGSIADRTGTLCTKHPWANHFKNMSINRETSPFNLVDVYRRMGDVPPGRRRLVYEVTSKAQAAADRLLSDMLAPNGDGSASPLLIAFQPGASQASRQWPAAAFARLGEALCNELGVRIIVLGTAKEAPLGEEIVEACPGRAASVMGQTSIGQLAALLQRCRLLVTNDTGTMHLACAVGTPVVSLFMGPALFYQTGPYGEGHLVLQAEIPCAPCNYLTHCTHQVCKEHIGWQAVARTVKWALAGKSQAAPAPVPSIGAYISGFDEDGYLCFVPLTKRPLDWPTFLRLAYREVWKVVLDGKPLTRACAAVIQEIARHYEWQKTVAELASRQEETAGDLDQLSALTQRGQTLTLELVEQARRRPTPVEHIRRLGKALEEVDEQLRILGTTKETLKPMIATFRFGKENLQGWELLSLAQQTLQVYDDLAHHTMTMAHVLAASMDELFTSMTTTSPQSPGDIA